jgi:hypothetical protein
LWTVKKCRFGAALLILWTNPSSAPVGSYLAKGSLALPRRQRNDVRMLRIQPPRPRIEDRDPFKEALSGRKELAESLTALIGNVSESLVIFVNAPWGEGKTTFSEMWIASLRQQKHEVIYFDAYACDYLEDPFVSFSAEIIALAEKKFQDIENIVRTKKKFRKAAVDVGKRLAGLGFKVGLRALSMGTVGSEDIADLKDIGDDAVKGVGEIGAELIEKRIDEHLKEKDALASFKDSLGKLASAVREQQNFPLTIIVDELDRCRPDFALGLLERIKHLFDVEGIAFVLLVNQEQIEGYIRGVYGQGIDARSYLLKFANLFVDLPKVQAGGSGVYGHANFCEALMEHFGIVMPPDDNGFFLRSIRSVRAHYSLTLRETERVFSLLSIYYASLPEGQFTNAFLIVLLSTLKVKETKLYQELSAGTIEAKRFLEESRLGELEEEPNFEVGREWVLRMINSCLLADEEFTKLPAQDPIRESAQWMTRSFRMRKDVIPFLCARLDRFAAKPL